MKIIYHILFNSYLFLFVVTTFSQEKNYYHNKEYKFRIKFPSGWQIQDGVGEHIVKKAIHDGSDVLVSVVDVMEIPGFLNEIKKDKSLTGLSKNEIIKIIESELDARKFSEIEFKAFMVDFISGNIKNMKTRFHNLEVIENKMTYLANTKFSYIKIKHQIRVLDQKIDFISLQFFSIRRGKIYSVVGGSKAINFKNMEYTILRSINSFQFEDWDIPLEPDEIDFNNNNDIFLIKIVGIGISLLLIIGFYARITGNKSNNKNNQFEDYVKYNTEPNNKKSNYYDIENYSEIDDSNMSEDEKMKVYGDLFELKGKVTKSEISEKYRELLKKYHPDKVTHLGKEFQVYAEKKTKDINKAYSFFKMKYNF